MFARPIVQRNRRGNLSLYIAELHTTDLMSPKGNIIFSSGDGASVMEDLSPTTDVDVVPELLKSVAEPKGVRFLAANVRKLTKWSQKEKNPLQRGLSKRYQRNVRCIFL